MKTQKLNIFYYDNKTWKVNIEDLEVILVPSILYVCKLSYSPFSVYNSKYTFHTGKWTEIVTFLNKKGLWTTVYWLVFTFENRHLGSLVRLQIALLDLKLQLVISCYILNFTFVTLLKAWDFWIDELLFELAGNVDPDEAGPRLSKADMEKTLYDPSRYHKFILHFSIF